MALELRPLASSNRRRCRSPFGALLRAVATDPNFAGTFGQAYGAFPRLARLALIDAVVNDATNEMLPVAAILLTLAEVESDPEVAIAIATYLARAGVVTRASGDSEAGTCIFARVNGSGFAEALRLHWSRGCVERSEYRPRLSLRELSHWVNVLDTIPIDLDTVATVLWRTRRERTLPPELPRFADAFG